MKIYKLALVILLPIMSSFCAHKYYLSVTELEYNEQQQSIQIITRLFYDDLEAVLQERYDDAITVDAQANQKILDTYLSKYLLQKMEITINGNSQELQFLGKEYEDDYVVCYIEITEVQDIESVRIENTVLMDLFPEQKNMVHTQILGKKKSLLLQDGNTDALLKFSQ